MIGYNRDPAWHFPALLRLLPERVGVISDEGAVSCAGLTYCHEVLKLWPGALVTVRCSVMADSDAWIYRDDEIICLAKARELQRKDGVTADFPLQWLRRYFAVDAIAGSTGDAQTARLSRVALKDQSD